MPTATMTPAEPVTLPTPPLHERLRQIECARRRVAGANRAQMAWYYNVSERTVERWTKAAYTYTDPEADELRALRDGAAAGG